MCLSLRSFLFLLAIAAFLQPIFSKQAAAADRAELDKRVAYWNERLPFCNWPKVSPYPSKYSDTVLYNNSDQTKGQCNDGDGVIFNGVLCLSGDERGCDAVKRSQAPDGEFWRSPRKVGHFDKDETPFSNDHVLGVWAYIALKKDKDAFNRWMDWIDGQPYPRFCQDKNCIFGISDCPMLDALALYLLASNKVCDPQHKVMDLAAKAAVDTQRRFNDAVAQLFKIPGSEVLKPAVEPLKASFNTGLTLLIKTTQKLEEVRIQAATYARALTGAPSLIVGINALVNKAGPGQWDAAVEVLLIKKFVGLAVPGFNDASAVLAAKQKRNPFFEYVAHGQTDRMLQLILDRCPSREHDPPHARFQWTWEREDDEKPPPEHNTMYWDCLAVANFYERPLPDPSAPLKAPDLTGAINQANADVANATATVNSIISTIEGLIKDCQKLQGKCVVAVLKAPLDRVKQEADHALDQISKGQVPTPIGAPTIPISAPSLPTPSNPIPEPPKIKVKGCPCHGFLCPCG
jgi:hypothetical protein